MNKVNKLRAKESHEQIAIDAETLARNFSSKRATALHSIAAWSKTSGLVLSQMKPQRKKIKMLTLMF